MTRQSLQAMKDKNDANLIGQFGVGFYSSFLVASRVRVQTKHKDDSQWMWESAAGSHSFKVHPTPWSGFQVFMGALLVGAVHLGCLFPR